MSLWALKNLLATLLLPPANGLLLLCLAGIFRRRRWAFGLAVAATLLLFVQSLPPVAALLVGTLERRAGPLLRDRPAAGAIVVLGGGLDADAPEYGGDTANERTLVRLRYGAALARQWHLPLLVSGGRPPHAKRSEADVMAGILQHEFGLVARWRENQSADTADNARFSAVLLRAAGIRRIVLVTQAYHMPRARLLFERAGLEVVPAPTAFERGQKTDWTMQDFLPQSRALRTTFFALHEWLGLAWAALLR